MSKKDDLFNAQRFRTGLAYRRFVEAVDNRLRGDWPPLPRSKKNLRGLVAKYGWKRTINAATEIADERVR